MLRESEAAVAEALALVEALTRSHPSLPAWLRSKQAALEILTEQHHFLDQLAEAGAWRLGPWETGAACWCCGTPARRETAISFGADVSACRLAATC